MRRARARVEIVAREKAYSQDLQRNGKWPHIWRLVGEYANVSIFDVESTGQASLGCEVTAVLEPIVGPSVEDADRRQADYFRAELRRHLQALGSPERDLPSAAAERRTILELLVKIDRAYGPQ